MKIPPVGRKLIILFHIIGVSLPLQLMKAAVQAESYNISSFFIVIHEPQRCLLTVAR